MWSFIDFALNTLILNVVLLHSFLFLYYWFCLSTSSTITLSYKFKNGLPLEGLNFVSGTSIILNFETNLAKNIFISVIANLCPIQTRWPDPKGLQVNSTILSAFSFKNRSGWNELGSGKNSSSKKWGRIYKSWFANFFSLILPLKKVLQFYLVSSNQNFSVEIRVNFFQIPKCAGRVGSWILVPFGILIPQTVASWTQSLSCSNAGGLNLSTSIIAASIKCMSLI